MNRILGAVLFSSVMFCALGQAGVVTVKQDGTGDYTTIQAAINAAVAGDIVDVYPGEYDENVALTKNIRLRGVKGPLLTKIIGAGDGIAVSGTNARIEGLTLTKARNAITSTVTCYLYNCILTGQGGYGYYALDGATVSTVMLNCIVAYCGSHGIYSYTGTTDIHITSTIFYKNRGYAICGAYWHQYISATYSCLYENGGGHTGGGELHVSCLVDVDPQFQNPGEYDFRLGDQSPCIDAGDSSPGSRDPDGTRNDVGIFGGPYAASFWYGHLDGPAVRDLRVIPPVINYGNTFRIQGTAEIR